MASPVTLRLDQEIRQRIAHIARRRRVTSSHIIREAIEAYVGGREAEVSPYEAVADLIGVVHGGNKARSTGTGRQFAALLKRRRARP